MSKSLLTESSIFSPGNRNESIQSNPTITPTSAEEILSNLLKSLPKTIKIAHEDFLKTPINNVTSHQRSVHLIKLTFHQLKNFFDASIQKLERLVEEFYDDKRVLTITEGGNDLQFFSKILMWKDIAEVDLWRYLNEMMKDFKELISETINEIIEMSTERGGVTPPRKKAKLDIKMLGERGQRILDEVGDYGTMRWEEERRMQKLELRKKYFHMGKETVLRKRESSNFNLEINGVKVDKSKISDDKGTQTGDEEYRSVPNIPKLPIQEKINYESEAQKLILMKFREEKPINQMNFYQAFLEKKWNFNQRCNIIF